jgi:hypothetical protein
VSAFHPERVAENEAFLREVNERIAEKTLELAGDGTEPAQQECDFLCACGRTDCSEIVSLTIAAYEDAQSQDDLFVVAPGHETPEIEHVVERHETYVVVRKNRGSKPEEAVDV